MIEFAQLAHDCAPQIHHNTMVHLVNAESSFNPFAIGVVGAHLERQPRNLSEATATASWLTQKGMNFSVGLAQINKTNFSKYQLSIENAFDPCTNLKVAASVLCECYARALHTVSDQEKALGDALSCYYSGNFVTGYTAGYVVKVVTGHSPRRADKSVAPAREAAMDKGQLPSALLF